MEASTLFIFDIDGTLVESDGLDDRLYLKAFREAFGVEKIDADWNNYRESTDTGIAEEIFKRHLGRPAEPEEYLRHRAVFVKLWDEALNGPEQVVRPVSGAVEIVTHLRREPRAGVAIATGGWQPTALRKLEAAGIPHEGLPAAFADDATRREQIITRAIERASTAGRPDRVLYIGDAPWDAAAAQKLGVGFVAIAGRTTAERFRELGATTIIEHYEDIKSTTAAFYEAAQPLPALIAAERTPAAGRACCR